MAWTSNELYRILNGLLSVYKPPNMSISKFGGIIQKYLAGGFNGLPNENERIVTEVVRNPDLKNEVIKVADLLSLPQVTGPGYYPTDFEIYAVNALPTFASGVQVIGIGPIGLAISSKMFEENCYLNVYRLTCMMGRSTYTGTPESATILRTSWKHVKKSKIDYILQNRLHHYISHSYVSAGLAPNSQAAYNALCNSGGILRPKAIAAEDRDNCDPVRKPSPIIYGLNCVKFDPPFFTTEIHVLNEDIDFIISFINEIGSKLKCALVLTQCRRLRHGRFCAESSLLLSDLKSFDPQVLVDHMNMTNTCHSFESLQADQKNIFLVNGNLDKGINISGADKSNGKFLK